VQRTQRQRPAAGRTLVGLVVEGSTQAAGVPGTAATWVAPIGMPVASRLERWGVVVAPALGAGCVGVVCARIPGVAGPQLGGRARCAAWPIASWSVLNGVYLLRSARGQDRFYSRNSKCMKAKGEGPHDSLREARARHALAADARRTRRRAAGALPPREPVQRV
jgi:hypothetical protein